MLPTPRPRPGRAGRRKPPIHKPHIHTSPTLPLPDSKEMASSRQAAKLGLCVMGVGTVRRFLIETDIPPHTHTPGTPFIHVHGGYSLQSGRELISSLCVSINRLQRDE